MILHSARSAQEIVTYFSETWPKKSSRKTMVVSQSGFLMIYPTMNIIYVYNIYYKIYGILIYNIIIYNII
jgi:hypothetical protein